ncbi:MAG: shikimate kinase [Bryobacteraceae bacterium]
MILKLKRTPGIYLAGFMGSGKTTIGGLLAYELGWTFVDIDQDIEASEGAAIHQIFETHGEEHFRKAETAAIQKRIRTIQTGRPMVVALGGGAFAQSANFELVQNNGVSLWLDCPLALARARASQHQLRPLARDPIHFEHLYFSRRASYQQADFRIEIAGDDPKPVISAILGLPIF